MNRKVYRLFSVAMVLVLAVTLSGIALIQGPAPASAVTSTALRWVEISTPGEDDLQLLPGSDVGVIAVSPDGATLFAAVNEQSSDYPPGAGGPNGWRVFKSTDGGYTWRETGFYADVNPTDASAIVDIVVSPLWENNPYVYVATQTRVWWSSDSGNNFGQMGAAMPNNINCMDVGVDKDNMLRVVVGNGIPDGTYNADVYLLVYDTWVRQHVGVGLCTVMCAGGGNYVDAVLDVAFAPTYGDEAMAGSGYGWIFALVRSEHYAPPSYIDQAILRCETQAATVIGDVGNWGSPVQDAYFYHNGAIECSGGGFSGHDCGILATRGRMAFADDFANQTSVFVGMTAFDCTGTDPRGDVFRVDIGTGIIYPSAIEDLNVRGDNTVCNIWSLDVSGDADSAYLLAGLHETSTTGAPSSWQSGVHFSDSGGATWMPSFKPPSGMLTFDPTKQWNWPELVMAPDFATSGIAYCGTYGAFSGFWASTYEGTSWNGRGLLDMDTQSITSIAVSPNYASDDNMFMVEKMTIEFFSSLPGVGPLGMLWETKDDGKHWEVILAMNSMFPLPGVNVEWVELPHDWPSDNSIFVTGRMSVQPAVTQSTIIRSSDGGKTFTTFIQGPQDPGFIYRPPAFGACWDTPNTDTIFIGDNNGGVWYTDDAGFLWNKCASTDIPDGQTITDLVERDGALLIGTDEGTVYFCYDWQTDFSIQRVGEIVGAVGDWTSVTFDAEYETNEIVYCGLWGATSGEVWRFDLGASMWEQISDTRNTNVPATWWNPPVHFADPPINGTFPMWVGSLDSAGNPLGGGALKCGEEGTLYTIDLNVNASNGVGNLSWRCTDPELETIDLGTSPLWEPLGDGLGLPFDTQKGMLMGDLEVVTGSNILFAIGLDKTVDHNPTIWTYHDTLTADLGPLDLIRPADGAIGVGTLAADNTEACLTLQWEPATDATKYEWEIGTGPELAVDGGFVSLWAHAQFLTYFEGDADTARFTNGEAINGCLPPGETYYWHVRVVEPFQSPWSEIWSFTTMPTSTGERPLLTSPANGETNVIRRPAFTWTQAVGAEEYELTIWECANAGSPVIEKTGDNAVTGLFYQTTQDLKYDTNYCWQVKALGGNDPVSASGTFTTLAQPVEEEEVGTPYWVWVVIGVSALMLVAVIVLIVLTKKA